MGICQPPGYRSQDRKALQEWVRAHDTGDREAEFMTALAGLPIGTACFWSPGWLDVFHQVKVRLRSTFDSSKTPKLGALVKGPERAAAVDLDALRAKLESTVEEARANDPKALRKRIADLEREARRRGEGELEAAAVARVEQVESQLRVAETRIQQLEAYTATLTGRIHEGRGLVDRLGDLLRNGVGPPAAAVPSIPPEMPRRAPSRTREIGARPRTPPETVRRDFDGDLPKGEHAVLTAA